MIFFLLLKDLNYSRQYSDDILQNYHGQIHSISVLFVMALELVCRKMTFHFQGVSESQEIFC